MSSSDLTGVPPSLDPVALAAWQRRAPAASPWLHEEVGRRMQERLDWIVRQPQRWCDWEPVRGGMAAHELVAQRYPGSARWLAHAQPAHQQRALQRWRPTGWTRLLRGNSLHFDAPAPGSMEMVWANMALHLAADPPGQIAQWAQWLQPDGFVMLSCFGPDTLAQLRTLYAQLGWPPPVQQFTDMHDLGDMLVAQGFAEPVMDMEHLQLEFADAERLLQELRELGRNLHRERFGGLRGRRWRAELVEALQGLRGTNGRITMTFEIVYGHAFKAAPQMKVAPQTAISLQDLRQALKKR